METCFNYCDKDIAYFSSDERKWITRIRRLQGKYPELVTILKQPEDNDGCIYARLPASALKIQLRDKKDLSEEQKQTLVDNLRRGREAKANN